MIQNWTQRSRPTYQQALQKSSQYSRWHEAQWSCSDAALWHSGAAVGLLWTPVGLQSRCCGPQWACNRAAVDPCRPAGGLLWAPVGLQKGSLGSDVSQKLGSSMFLGSRKGWGYDKYAYVTKILRLGGLTWARSLFHRCFKGPARAGNKIKMPRTQKTQMLRGAAR